MLTDEEKRWLVVGICLSKVLTPAIREVIEQELQQLYQNLIQPPTNIHLQTSASHLKYLPPSTLRLNYININNNRAQASHHSYDYSVKDEVSLTKLFVKPFMSGFTGFDESLDSSAALSILCGAPNFVYHGIDIIAMDVRNDVRNEWGHCKFPTWTEAYYLKCFQLMENLIKRLNLPVTFEAKVLDDLKEWRNRGIDMCFGQPVNNDVLKLVQEEMATLVTSVEENKETWMQDHEGLRSNLQNLTQLFALDIKRLEAKHVALESGLNDLKEDQLKIKELVVENENIASSNATLIHQVRDRFEDERKGLRSRQEVLEGKVVGLSQGMDKMTSKEINFFKSGLHWKLPLVVLFGILLLFLYEYYSRGSMLRYWYCRRGSIPGHTLSFVFKTHDQQTPTVNGVEFSWEKLKTKLGLNFQPINVSGARYYLNIDRCAWGGVITVRSVLDNTPQVRGAEVLAVNSECTQVYYNDDGIWKRYESTTKSSIRCTVANR
ncbi:hypothetical protein ACROYT_G001948 [Oculina patagonica]